jgi:DNA-binding NarL/FixJ family response regulator
MYPALPACSIFYLILKKEPMSAPVIKYVIADDHTIFRQGLRLVLSEDPHLSLLAEAADGLALLNILKQTSPDVILLDLKMPGMDGIEATREIRAAYPQIKILILTMHDDEQLIIHLLEAGANGYLIKNTDADEIKLALHACYENGYYFSDYISSLMLKTLMQKNKTPPTFKAQIILNDRELEVLQLICEGFTALEIGKKIYLSNRTVEGIKAALLEKIGVRNAAGLIMYAVKQGLVT